MTTPQHLGAWVHDLSPWVIRFTDTFGIRWYGLSYLAGFALAYLLFRWLARRRFTPIPPDRVLDAVMLAVLGVVVGGRLGYVLFYEPSLLGFSDRFPYWGVLALNRGGMASHGGIAGVIIASWFISRGFKDEHGQRIGASPPAHVMDITAMICPVGLMLGRIANFINAELLGRIVAAPGQPAPRWSVRYPQEIVQFPPDQLAQTPDQWAALARLGYAELPATDQLLLGPNPDPTHPIMLEGYERLFDRLQHGATDLAPQLEHLISARAPSQLLQAAAEGIVLGAVVWFVARIPRRPGVIGCWFMITYGVLRIATEFVRLPDPELGRTLGLSRGQWLSTLMIAVGLFMLAWITHRQAPKLGGWSRR